MFDSWPFLRDSKRVAGVEMAAQLLVLEYNLLVAQLTSRGKRLLYFFTLFQVV